MEERIIDSDMRITYDYNETDYDSVSCNERR